MIIRIECRINLKMAKFTETQFSECFCLTHAHPAISISGISVVVVVVRVIPSASASSSSTRVTRSISPVSEPNGFWKSLPKYKFLKQITNSHIDNEENGVDRENDCLEFDDTFYARFLGKKYQRKQVITDFDLVDHATYQHDEKSE